MKLAMLLLLLITHLAAALPTANPQISDPIGANTCVAEVLGNPPRSGAWVVKVVLRNEISMEVNSSGQDVLNVGNSRSLGGLGPDVAWTYSGNGELDFTYADLAWKFSQCNVYTMEGAPYRRCTFPCRGYWGGKDLTRGGRQHRAEAT